MKRKAKFRRGQVVYVRDWKGTERLGKVVSVHRYDDRVQYMVEWIISERIMFDTSAEMSASDVTVRPLTKREKG